MRAERPLTDVRGSVDPARYRAATKGSGLYLWLLAFLSSGACLLGAVEGVVVNATTGKPQPSAIVSLVQPGSSGMQTLASVKSGADGTFKIDKDIPPGPALVQALHQGATYNLILTPGSPTTGLAVQVYNSTAKSGVAKIDQHMIVIDRSDSALRISETLLIKNDTNLTFADPAKGSARFYVPGPPPDNLTVSIEGPDRMPIQRPAEKTNQTGVYKVGYPLKPGDTRFDISYTLPASDKFAGKNFEPEQPVRLVTASSVTLSGDGLESLGQEPQTQAHIYSVSGIAYEVGIDGTGSLRTPESSDSQQPQQDSGEPPIEAAPARVYTRLGWVLGLALGILALGGTLLYRRGAA